MPHPGKNVTSDPKFKGKIKDIDPDFIKYLKEFVSLNLAPENVVPKLMNGQQIHCEELIQYFNSYMKIFNSDEMLSQSPCLKQLLRPIIYQLCILPMTPIIRV